MRYVCLWSPGGWTDAARASELATSLLDVSPRIVVEARGVVWADARGLRAEEVGARLLERCVAALGDEAWVGVGAVPLVAECAARSARGRGRMRVVEAGRERAFLASLPLSYLDPPDTLRMLLEGVGVERCGELAVLEREAVEVRFGPEAVAVWRRARAEDERRIFPPVPPERPHASLDFIDYVVTAPERLLFTVHALLGGIVERLRSRGEHARGLLLTLALADGTHLRRILRPARPTASRDAWLRLARITLERLTLPDAVTGVALEVVATEAAAVQQGDLFDRGFATAGAVEEAVARLVDRLGPVIAPAATGEGGGGEARLTLQLLPEPRPIEVEAVTRRDHVLPVRYRDGERWVRLVTAAGPDRISGGQWDGGYAREYFRCVTTEGVLVWVYRDGVRDAWYLHGWWD